MSPIKSLQRLAQFFRKGNLTALRELAMRTAAQRVDEQMRAYMEEKSIRGPWPTGERLLVWISPDAASTNLVRNARRLAVQMGAEWFAVQVETPASVHLSPEQREALTNALQLAEKLGARVISLQGQTVSEAIGEYARKHNINKIVVGQTPSTPLARMVSRSVDQPDNSAKSGSGCLYYPNQTGTIPKRKKTHFPTWRYAHAI